jgi:spore coat-associated protein N
MDQAAYDLPTRPRRKRRLMIAILLGSAIAMLGAATMSLAVFTDQDTNTGSWSTGTVVLNVTPAVVFSVPAAMPGDTGNQTVTVENNGTGDLRYAMTTSAGNADGKGLAAQLRLRIDEGACGAVTGNLYDGALNVAKLGNPAQGPQTGDRNVSALGSDTLCFTWTFPKSSGDAFQNAKTTATFTFDAEQTANNP